VDSVVKRHAEGPCETKTALHENSRLEVPQVFLEAVIEGFRGHAQNSCVELVFHLDEIDISKWEDRTER
jgi:hypothetical protein